MPNKCNKQKNEDATMKLLSKNILVLVLFSLLSLYSKARFLPLPVAFSEKAVSHIQVRQLDEFSCGYNALFNACNVEQWFGVSSKYSIYSNFHDKVMKYLSAHKLHRQQALSTDLMQELASQLGIEVFSVVLEPEGLKFLGNVSVSIECPIKTSSADKEKLKQQAFKAFHERKLEKIKRSLAKDQGKVTIIHFFCCTEGEIPHVFVISLVQNKQGKRALYVCDNLNSEIYASFAADKQKEYMTPAGSFLTFFTKYFGISLRSQFHAPALPDYWLTAPLTKNEIILKKILNQRL